MLGNYHELLCSPPNILKIDMIILISMMRKLKLGKLPQATSCLVPGLKFKLRFESSPNTLTYYY